MSKYLFNGPNPPAFPERDKISYPYEVMVYKPDTDDFFLFYSNSQFSAQLIDGTQTIAFPVGSSCYLFMCNQDSMEWTGGLFEPTGEDSDNDEWYTIPTYASFVWCNRNICDADGNVVYVSSNSLSKFDRTSMMVGLLVGRIAGQRKKQPAPPVEPDAPSVDSGMYLYGTPSESGNIGLRVGDTVTYYDGVVAPELSVVDVLPYVAIVKLTKGTIRAVYSSIPILHNDSTGNIILGGVMGKYACYDIVESVWSNTVPTATTMNGYSVLTPVILWSNHDIENVDDVVRFAKSADPLSVSGLVGYSYRKSQLPILPDWDKTQYPYVFIQTRRGVLGTGMAFSRLYLSSIPATYYPDNITEDGTELAGPFVIYSGEHEFLHYSIQWNEGETQWKLTEGAQAEQERFQITTGMYPDKCWTNHAILDGTDGTVYLEASEPVPVYE